MRKLHVKNWITKPYALLLVSLGGATVAALLVFLIGGWVDGHWDFLDFGQDLVKNAFIGTLVVAATTWVQQRRDDWRVRNEQQAAAVRQGDLIALASAGWIQLQLIFPDEQWSTPDIKELAQKYGKFADELEKLQCLAKESHKNRRAILATLRLVVGRLSSYGAEGDRARRFMYIRRLCDELRPLETASDRALAGHVRKFRDLAIGAEAWGLATNSVIIERLIVERSAPLQGAHFPKTNDLFVSARELPLGESATAFDPTYLLFTHIKQVIALHRNEGDLQFIPLLMDQIGRCIGALVMEVRIIAKVSAALADINDIVCIDREPSEP